MRDATARDHYRTLQVTRDAEPEVIERAYRALALKYHPDVSAPGRRRDAHLHMQALNEAYSVLKNPVARKNYDATLPSSGASGWEEFLENGLVGLFRKRRFSR
jgi:DnaJ-class molecular chaperone